MAVLALPVVLGVLGSLAGSAAASTLGIAAATAASIGASIGMAAGSALAQVIDGPKRLPTTYGPRLADRGVQSSAFGAHINVLFGMDRIAGNIIFASQIKETP